MAEKKKNRRLSNVGLMALKNNILSSVNNINQGSANQSNTNNNEEDWADVLAKVIGHPAFLSIVDLVAPNAKNSSWYKTILSTTRLLSPMSDPSHYRNIASTAKDLYDYTRSPAFGAMLSSTPTNTIQESNDPITQRIRDIINKPGMASILDNINGFIRWQREPRIPMVNLQGETEYMPWEV